jgi:Ca-activated chloride channel family protein
VSKVSLSVVPVVVVLSAVAAAAQQPPAPAMAGSHAASAYGPDPARPSFTSGIDLVALTVTVTDANRRHISNLSADDFQVFEDGVLQRVSFFGMSDVALDVALLVDGSASMTDALPLARDAARGLLGTLRAGDRASLVEFRSTVRVTEPLTSDLARVAAGLERLTAAGGTTLHNALYVTLKEFQKQAAAEAEVRRRAIVVLSDGEDTGSLIGFEEVLDLARRAAVTIYTVGLKNEVQLLREKSRRNGRRFFDQSDYALRRLADETGARAFFPEGVQDLPAVYDTIAAELSSQYALGYVSRNPVRNGAWRRLRVRVAEQPGVRSRTRLGYFADARR